MPCARNLRLARALGRRLEDFDECVADDLSLPLRIRHPFQPGEKQWRGVFVLELHFEMAAEDLLHHLGLARAEQTVVDENAGELIADGLVEQRGGDARIHPAAQARG